MSPDFLFGATALGCLVITLFFARFWRDTGDRFFALFALAFALFAVNRTILAFIDQEAEASPGPYILRLLAFLLIIAAVVDKNRRPVTD